MAVVVELFRKREIPVILCAMLIVLISFGSYFSGTAFQPLLNFGTVMKNWCVIITAYTIFFGMVRLVQYEIKDMQRRESLYSVFLAAWTLLITFFVIIVAFIPPQLSNPYYNYWILNVVGYGDGTLWSLFFLSVVGASMRAFQIRNLETAFFVVAMFLWLIIYIPMNIPYVNDLGQWVMSYIDLPGARGGFTTLEAVASLGVVIRVIFGRERGFFR